MSRYVREHFAAAWESLRPVPRATIDFGAGHRLERTLRGNVATYFCAPDGTVIDVVVGLCDPEHFLARLASARSLLANHPGDRLERAVLAVHTQHARGLRPPASTARSSAPRSDIGKSVGETPVFDAFGLVEPAPAPVRTDKAKRELETRGRAEAGLAALPAGVDIEWKSARDDPAGDRALLLQDSGMNRIARDPLVHALLAERIVRPHDIDRRLFREVLHVDLDDPWLGLADGPFGGGAYDGHDRVVD